MHMHYANCTYQTGLLGEVDDDKSGTALLLRWKLCYLELLSDARHNSSLSVLGHDMITYTSRELAHL